MRLATRSSAGLRLARASWCGLWSIIVTRSGATARTMPEVVKPVPAPTSATSRSGRSRRARRRGAEARGGEAGARADVGDVEVGPVEAAERERGVAHRLGPEQRVDPPVVAERDDAVEPEGLGLVLDEPHGRQPTR